MLMNSLKGVREREGSRMVLSLWPEGLECIVLWLEDRVAPYPSSQASMDFSRESSGRS